MEIKDYFDIIEKGVQRTRSILYIITIASIVSFVSNWNINSSNWLDSRIKIRQNILNWFPYNDSVRKSLSFENQIQFEDAKKMALLMGSENQDPSFFKVKMQESILELNKIKTSRSFIEIPIFNVNIDINDISIFTGLTFICLLFMLRASLWREVSNTKFIFDLANRQDQLEETYQYLSMTQVLSNPPSKYAIKNDFWIKFSKIIIVPPFLIEFFNCYENITTFDIGYIQNKLLTWLVTILSILFLLLITLLSISCFSLLSKHKKIWVNYFNLIQ